MSFHPRPVSEPLDKVEVGWRQPEKSSRRKGFFDRLLLFVEIVAVIGLVVILANGINLVKTLNQEVVRALTPATPIPTPLIVAVVLPSGHTPPTASGGTQPNEAEIPENLRPLTEAIPSVPEPTSGPEQAIRIQIPAINVDAPVVQGDGWEQLKKGVAQHLGSADPGQKGNLVLSAHNDVYGQIFRDLDRLKNGDTIVVYTASRQYSYVVTGTRIVEPTQVDAMDPTESPTVTLVSCYPYLVDNQRIIVTAILKDNPE